MVVRCAFAFRAEARPLVRAVREARRAARGRQGSLEHLRNGLERRLGEPVPDVSELLLDPTPRRDEESGAEPLPSSEAAASG